MKYSSPGLRYRVLHNHDLSGLSVGVLLKLGCQSPSSVVQRSRIHILSATPSDPPKVGEVTWETLGFNPPPRERKP